jgi:carbonic anhydrase
MSVIQYAVDVLKVKHIIVCGHYSCGGVAAAISGDTILGKLGEWIQPIKGVHQLHIDELNAKEPKTNLNRMCELNVLDQTNRLSQNETVKGAWDRDQPLQIHSWVYNLEDGNLKPLRDPITE